MFKIDFAVFFGMQSAPHAFFAGIELQHVAFSFESDLPLSTMSVCLSVCLSVRTPVSNFQYTTITPL